MAKAAVVQYRTRADAAERNRALAQRVVTELRERDPGGLCHCVVQLEDGVGFIHIAVFDGTTDPFANSRAHAEFHRGLCTRVVGHPNVIRASTIGCYAGMRTSRGRG